MIAVEPSGHSTPRYRGHFEVSRRRRSDGGPSAIDTDSALLPGLRVKTGWLTSAWRRIAPEKNALPSGVTIHQRSSRSRRKYPALLNRFPVRPPYESSSSADPTIREAPPAGRAAPATEARGPVQERRKVGARCCPSLEAVVRCLYKTCHQGTARIRSEIHSASLPQ